MEAGLPLPRQAQDAVAGFLPHGLRAAQWEEFDLTAATWTIPAAHTKMRKEHTIPLCSEALQILVNLHKLTGKGELVFPSARNPRNPLSESTLNAALRRMGYKKEAATAHGFRTTASSLLNDSGYWHPDAIERQLAHKETDRARSRLGAATRTEAIARAISSRLIAP